MEISRVTPPYQQYNMGARESSPDPRAEAKGAQEQVQHVYFRELYIDLTAPDHQGAPVDQKIFRVS